MQQDISSVIILPKHPCFAWMGLSNFYFPDIIDIMLLTLVFVSDIWDFCLFCILFLTWHEFRPLYHSCGDVFTLLSCVTASLTIYGVQYHRGVFSRMGSGAETLAYRAKQTILPCMFSLAIAVVPAPSKVVWWVLLGIHVVGSPVVSTIVHRICNQQLSMVYLKSGSVSGKYPVLRPSMVFKSSLSMTPLDFLQAIPISD